MKVPRDMLLNKLRDTCIYEGSSRHVTKQALRYVQLYEGTQRHVTKQALRYIHLNI